MKTVLVNVEDRELRIAILENGQLTELYIEPLDDRTILNNIYKGRVEGVLPGLSAAFVNIGLGRNAFLHFDDVRPDLLEQLQAMREGREVPVTGQVPELETSEEPPESTAYVPTPEELEVLQKLAEEPEPETEEKELPVMALETSQRKRRRGRRGGRHRRNKRWMDTSAQSSARPALGTQGSSETSNGSTFSRDDEGATSAQSSVVAGASDAHTSPTPPYAVHRRERQQTKERHKARPAQRHPARPIQPPPDALRGTRAAMTAYDVYPALPQPKKQKTERKRRRKQPSPLAQSSWYSSSYPPPDAPIEKDSQLDFFGPAEPTPMPPDEPVEDVAYAAPAEGPRSNGEFLDEVSESSATSESEATSAATRGARRRAMRRRTSSPYALRKKTTAKTTDDMSSSDQQEVAAPKRSRSRRKKAEETLAVEDRGESAPESAAQSETEPQQSKPAATVSRRPSTRASRTTKRKKDEAPTPTAPAAGEPESPIEKGGGELKSESPSKRAKRTSKKALSQEEKEPESLVLEPPATDGSQVSPKPKRGTRKRAAKQADELNVAAEVATPAPPVASLEPQVAERTVGGEDERPAASEELASEQELPTVAFAETPAQPIESALCSDASVAAPPSEAAVEVTEAPAPVPGELEPAVTLPPSAEMAAEPAAGEPEQTKSAPLEVGPELSAEKAGVPVASEEELSPAPDGVPPDVPSATARPQGKFYRRHGLPKVHEVLRKGDEILVQVTKEEIGEKGARISTYISLPGRYLVLLPYGNNEGGVSRRVEKFEERRRLKKLQRKLRRDLGIEHMGLIIRTAGMEKTEYELRKDAEFLLKEWKAVQERAANSQAPALVYDDSDILYRLCRDVFDESIEKIVVDNPEYAEKIRGILENMIPELAPRVELYEEPINLFARYEVDEKIRKAGRRRVWLKSGGYIIIDEAEALTAIDVNTGKFVGKDNQEQMILKTNLEAAQVIARELKLRDIGGIIVIDFIDMRDPRNREKLLEEFRALLRKDHAKTAVSGISEFGLVEMTRKRVRQSLRKTIFQECPYCRGSGVVFTQQEIWVHLKNMLVETLEKNYPRPDLVVHVNPTLKDFIEKNCGETVTRLEQKYGVRITFSPSELIHIEHFTVEKKQRESSVLDTLMGVSSSETSSA